MRGGDLLDRSIVLRSRLNIQREATHGRRSSAICHIPDRIAADLHGDGIRVRHVVRLSHEFKLVSRKRRGTQFRAVVPIAGNFDHTFTGRPNLYQGIDNGKTVAGKTRTGIRQQRESRERQLRPQSELSFVGSKICAVLRR
jgi:hypothetical protein